MKKTEENRSRRLTFRLKPEEYSLIEERFKSTMCQKISEYSRNVLLGKPIVVNYRDHAMDEMLEELIIRRKELQAIGINFNQAVQKLNSATGMPEADVWQLVVNILTDKLEPSIREIKDKIVQYSDIWSQGLSMKK